jgi:heme oxygenase
LLLFAPPKGPAGDEWTLMTTDTAGPPAQTSAPGLLRQQLRREGAEAHQKLEDALDLLGRVSDRQRFVRVLERFLGFHLVWERAIRQHAALRPLHAARSRLPHLRRDLAALGRTNAEQAQAPLCMAAAALADSPAAAVGSLYVLEGSTLGGQVIGRALAAADWVPPGGLTYFNPYQARTGEMWRAFGDWAEAHVPADERAAAVTGSNLTFAVLQEWLTS